MVARASGEHGVRRFLCNVTPPHMRKHSVAVIFSLTVLFGLGWLNILFPRIEFSNWNANQLVELAIFSIPLLLALCCFFLQKRIHKIVLAIFLTPLILLSLPEQLLTLWDIAEGEDGNRLQLQRLSYGDSSVVAYKIYARDSWGLRVYQERPLVAGINLVKMVYNGEFGEGHGDVRIELVESKSERLLKIQDWDKQFLVPIKRFVYY